MHYTMYSLNLPLSFKFIQKNLPQEKLQVQELELEKQGQVNSRLEEALMTNKRDCDPEDMETGKSI